VIEIVEKNFLMSLKDIEKKEFKIFQLVSTNFAITLCTVTKFYIFYEEFKKEMRNF